MENKWKIITFAFNNEGQPKLKIQPPIFCTAKPKKPMGNQWKTITFALHTEGQPKLNFSEPEFSAPQKAKNKNTYGKPMENHHFCFPF